MRTGSDLWRKPEAGGGVHILQGGFRSGLSLKRQVLLADLAISDARARGRQIRLVALDLVKAFDMIPKEFAVHCAVNLLKDHCPRLANLVASISLERIDAQIGEQRFAVRTGVPQGGVLTPWLFICAMNDLARRINDGGYTLQDCTRIGNPLYADDVLLVDDSADESESRCRFVESWVHEWGGKLNSGKTQ